MIFFQVSIHCFCLVGFGIPSTNAEVVSSFFGLKKVKDIERRSFEVASITKEAQTLNCAQSCLQDPSCSLASFDQDIGCLLSREKNNDNSPESFADVRLINPDLTHYKRLGEFNPERRRFMSSDDLTESGSGVASSCADIKNKTKTISNFAREKSTITERVITLLGKCEVEYSKRSSHINFSSGIYSIKLPEDRFVQVYCIMDNIPGCDVGGWALVMKLDGLKSTFSYESSYWTDKQTLNYPGNMAALDDKEMKSPIFWEMKARKICIGMRRGNVTNWLQTALGVSSLRSLFASGSKFGTNLGKSSWKRLIEGSYLLDVCTSEGFNIVSGKAGTILKMRIGIIGSGLPCYSPKSFIGFGSNIITSSGNVIVGQHETKTFGYILVK